MFSHVLAVLPLASSSFLAGLLSGAGKTFTMIGDTRTYKNRGVSPRAIAQVFQDIASHPETAFEVHVSYMEIYNERIFDLLDPENTSTEFVLMEDRVHGVMVKGLTLTRVEGEEDALSALFSGELNRTTAEHMLNKNSNRSHCLFTMHLSRRSRLGTREKVMSSKLHLVSVGDVR
jgi:kinesin family member 6/9